MTTLFINFWFLSPWLIWNSYLLYYALIEDKNFMFIITSKKQLLTYWFYIGLFLVLGIYIFCLRLNRVNLSINVYKIINNIDQLIDYLSWQGVIGMCLFILLLIIFWTLLLRNIYKNFRKCLYSLYLYYYQYKGFWEFTQRLIHIEGDFTLYFSRRVRIFTSKPKIISFTLFLWPYCLFLIEKKIFSYLIPYIVVFDMLTQDGNISHVFVILPWFYIYTILRSTKILLDQFFLTTDINLVDEAYGLNK